MSFGTSGASAKQGHGREPASVVQQLSRAAAGARRLDRDTRQGNRGLTASRGNPKASFFSLNQADTRPILNFECITILSAHGAGRGEEEEEKACDWWDEGKKWRKNE